MFHEALLRREDSVLVLVDCQEKLMPAMADAETLTRNLGRLLEGARLLGVPVLVTEQYPKGLGPTIPPLADRLPPDATRFVKLAFSAAGEEAFFDALEETGREQVLLVGVEAHICVLQTALDLVERGLSVQVAADAVASRDPRHVANALQRLTREGVIVTNHESALFEWLGVADGEAFKAISKLVR